MPEAIPTEIEFHKRSRVLSIAFADGRQFNLPCEYLRVFAKAAEHRVLEDPVTGKEQVNIEKIEPQGSYALRLYFDDGHDTSIYSFETLYELGLNQETNWNAYRARVNELGEEPESEENDDEGVHVTVSFLDWLGDAVDTDEETLQLPSGEATVADVLTLLRSRSDHWARLLADELIELEIDYEEVEADAPLEPWDELVIRPINSTPPDG